MEDLGGSRILRWTGRPCFAVSIGLMGLSLSRVWQSQSVQASQRGLSVDVTEIAVGDFERGNRMVVEFTVTNSTTHAAANLSGGEQSFVWQCLPWLECSTGE
jgi:hypothetical protein